MKMTKLVSLVLCVAGVAACSSGPADPGAAPAGSSSTKGDLTAQVGEQLVSGSFASGADTVDFSSTARAGDVYEVTLKVHGMTLDATFSLADDVASFDGFTTKTGEDTQMQDADRAAVLGFHQAIDAKNVKGAPKALDMLVRASAIWAEHGSSVPLSRRVMGEEGRSWTLLCDRLFTWVDGTHDDFSRNRWDSTSSYHVSIGDYGTGSTFYWRNNAWSTQAFDHASWPYEYGDCYGRCGSDCGSGHVYSQDCLDHDGCVRNGHDIASLWCDDEFTSSSDDFAFAPNCY